MIEGEIAVGIRGLRKSFGDTTAVNGLSLEVRRGEIFGFLGPNGAGKTTTISMVCGLLRADAGEIHINGSPVRPDGRTDRHILGHCPQDLAIWGMLTCQEQLEFLAQQHDLPWKEGKRRARELLGDLGLGEKANRLAGTLSGGMKRRLNIALALVHDPEILILDEPQAGLDPQSRIMIREHIRALAGSRTVILTTHDMDEVDRMADRVAIIDRGDLLVLDRPEALKRRHGPAEIIEVRIGREGELDLAALQEMARGGECRLSGENGTLTVTAPGALEILPGILERLQEAGVEVRDLALRRRTLEDVFIDLTGRSLRE